MELIPKDLINKLNIPKLYETEELTDPIAYVKLFLDGWSWFITEISIDKNISDLNGKDTASEVEFVYEEF